MWITIFGIKSLELSPAMNTRKCRRRSLLSAYLKGRKGQLVQSEGSLICYGGYGVDRSPIWRLKQSIFSTSIVSISPSTFTKYVLPSFKGHNFLSKTEYPNLVNIARGSVGSRINLQIQSVNNTQDSINPTARVLLKCPWLRMDNWFYFW